MSTLSITRPHLLVGLFGRVAGFREFFKLFREAAEHEFFLSQDEVLEDWRHNCSAVRYALEPMYKKLQKILRKVSGSDPEAQQSVKENNSRCLCVQSAIVKAFEWLNGESVFTESVRTELARRLLKIESALELWRDRLIRDLSNCDSSILDRLAVLKSDPEARLWVSNIANQFFPHPRRSARFEKVIAADLGDLIRQFREAVTECANVTTISSSLKEFDSPPMAMCMKGRHLYLGSLQAVFLATDELAEHDIDTILDCFEAAKEAAMRLIAKLNLNSRSVSHQSREFGGFEKSFLSEQPDTFPAKLDSNCPSISDLLDKSLNSLTQRLEVLRSHLPIDRFDRLALSHA